MRHSLTTAVSAGEFMGFLDDYWKICVNWANTKWPQFTRLKGRAPWGKYNLHD